MNQREFLQNAIDYVGAHLDQPLDCAAVARQACLSPSHFQRLFAILNGYTLANTYAIDVCPGQRGNCVLRNASFSTSPSATTILPRRALHRYMHPLGRAQPRARASRVFAPLRYKFFIRRKRSERHDARFAAGLLR